VVRFFIGSCRIPGWSLKNLSIGFKHQRCGPYQPRPAALVLRTKKKKPYLIPLTARTQDLLVLSPGGEGMVRNDFLLAYAYLGRCPRLVWVGPLALKPDYIQYHHPGIRNEPFYLPEIAHGTPRKLSDLYQLFMRSENKSPAFF